MSRCSDRPAPGTFIGEEEEEEVLRGPSCGHRSWGWAGGSVPSHRFLDPPGVFAEVDVDTGFLGVPADARAPGDNALEPSITHEGSPGVTLPGKEGWHPGAWGSQPAP